MNFILLASLLACGEKSTDTASTDTTDTNEPSSAEPGSENQPDERDPDPSNGSTPEVTSFDAWCYADSNGVETWGFAIDYMDPDGDDTIQGYNQEQYGHSTVVVRKSQQGIQSAIEMAPASPTLSLLRLVESAVQLQESTTFSVTLVDNDGNSSNTVEVNGRAGTGVDG